MTPEAATLRDVAITLGVDPSGDVLGVARQAAAAARELDTALLVLASLGQPAEPLPAAVKRLARVADDALGMVEAAQARADELGERLRERRRERDEARAEAERPSTQAPERAAILAGIDALGSTAADVEARNAARDAVRALGGFVPPPPPFDLHAFLSQQREWSERTFGPGARPLGIIDHIRKELREIEAEPDDLEEWIDVVLLALDGAWRAGYSPGEIIAQLDAKQAKNRARQWPKASDPLKATEHVRDAHGGEG